MMGARAVRAAVAVGVVVAALVVAASASEG